MEPERQSRVEQLVEDALELDENQRSEFLERHCAGDQNLRAEVESLLVYEKDAQSFMESPALEVAAEALAEVPFATQRTEDDPVPGGQLGSDAQLKAELPVEVGLEGRRIGAYTLVSHIGTGGMGTVWLAERSDGRFTRRTAVKFLSLPVAGRAGAERFKREGSIVGRLAHPHIAELIDAGVSAEGQPYLVLEYVEGERIDDYCDQHRLDVEARIRLFLDVLSAVAHAHANLIVHRDLKPSNVLVRKDGQVKLLDFGIAKLLEDEGQAAAATVLTREAGGALTPAYAAPEQVTSGPITTATDVYSLGVLLYILLTGQHPGGAAALSPADLVKAIMDTEPTRMSDVVASAPREWVTSNAANRFTTPEKLRRQLRGDLDTVVAKALKKYPHERYASVTALVDDLRCYLNHEPISARPDTLSYRTVRFVRRNRIAVMLAALAFAAMIAGVTATLIQARTAQLQRDFAIRQLSRAEAVNDLNSFIFDQAPAAQEVIDRAEQVLGRQKELPLANRVEILIALSLEAGVEGGDTRSRRLIEEAYQLAHELKEPSIRAKAACALGRQLGRSNELLRAEGLIREGLSQLPAEPQFALDRAYCLMDGGIVSRTNGATGEAILRLQHAQGLLKQALPHSEMLDLDVSMDLADSFRVAGRNREACAEFQKLSERLMALGQDDTGRAGTVYYKWGLSLSQLGRPLEAEKLIHRAIVQFSDSEDDPKVIPWQLINHAKVMRDLGKLDKAAEQAERGYARSLETNNQVWMNQALLLRASIYRLSRDLGRAQDMLVELEPRLRRSLPPGNIFFAWLSAEQALTAEARGDRSAALDAINQALRIAEASAKSGQQGADLIPALLTNRSDIWRQLGRTDDAVADAVHALGLVREAAQPGTFSSTLGAAYLTLGRALQAQGKGEEARAAFRSAAEHLQNTVGLDHPDTRAARQLVGLNREAP